MSIINSKFYALYRTLNKNEQKAYQEFVASPYFNKNEAVVRLVQFLSELNNPNISNLDKSTIFKEVYGNKTYKDAQLRSLLNIALSLLKRFLADLEFDKDKSAQQMAFLRAIENRNAPYFTQKINGDEIERLDQEPQKDIKDWYDLYQLELMKYNRSSLTERKEDTNINRLAQSFETYLSLNLLNLANTALNIQNILSNEHQFQLLPAILQKLDEEALDQNPLLKLYYYGHHLLAMPEESERFGAYKKVLLENEKFLSEKDIRDAYVLAINHCIKALNKGQRSYENDLLELYTQGLQNKAIYQGKVLPSATYKNIVRIGLRLNKSDWTKAFIEEYQQDIPARERQSVYAYNLASWYFHQASYQESIDVIQQVKINDIFTDLASRLLIIKAYYEIQEFKLLDSLADNFKQLLYRKRISVYHKNSYLNFIKLLIALSKLNYYDSKSVTKYREKLKSMAPLSERDWLLEKLDSLVRP